MWTWQISELPYIHDGNDEGEEDDDEEEASDSSRNSSLKPFCDLKPFCTYRVETASPSVASFACARVIKSNYFLL